MKRRAAFMAMLRYVTQAVLAAFVAWMQQVGKQGWESLNSFDFCFIVASLGVVALNSMGSTMNPRWHIAQLEKEKDSK